MSVLTQFTPAALKILRPEMEADLAVIGKKYGISFKVGNGSYSDIAATFKVEMALVGDIDGKTPEQVQQEVARKEFEKYAPLFGLKGTDFGATVDVYGDKFEIVGIKPNSPKNRYLGKKINGKGSKNFILPADVVERQLKAA